MGIYGIAGATPILQMLLVLLQAQLTLVAGSSLPLAWVKQRYHFSIGLSGRELEAGPVSLTGIPFPAGALPNRMLQCGKVAWQSGFKPCSHCGCCLVGSEPDLGYGTQPHLWMQSAHRLQQQLMDTPVY